MARMLPTLLLVAVALAAGYFMFMKAGDVSSAEARLRMSGHREHRNRPIVNAQIAAS
jgi:hypothetical protein